MSLLVLHDVGDDGAGAPWAAAFVAADWPGTVLAPDLPGHGTEPPPVGGAYELDDPAYAAVRALHRAQWPAAPVVVGVGVSGWAAQLLGLGGRAAALVLVDGLGGPWREPAGQVADVREWLRALAADPRAQEPFAGPGLDPRLVHGVPRQTSRLTAERAAAALSLPVLVVSTPADPLPAADRDALVARFAGPVTVVEADDRDPAAAAAAVVPWAASHESSPARPQVG